MVVGFRYKGKLDLFLIHVVFQQGLSRCCMVKINLIEAIKLRTGRYDRDRDRRGGVIYGSALEGVASAPMPFCILEAYKLLSRRYRLSLGVPGIRTYGTILPCQWLRGSCLSRAHTPNT
ncbi:uncharacterized protein LOC113465214 [Ceratina calcarata]|uniref:Uncharacterized protein LOC113465214 n=1 Tax=Ceratina calcarata TaxID=156304 RepID=A0AAJ7SCC0_9HYME|nr:uncharacterized protein LOC113465214 [Ceratina calcarata]